jgi:hypothetical protein
MESSFSGNVEGLHKLVKALGDKHWIKLGIFGAKDSRNGKNQENDNAYLAAIHELGKPSKRIPQRSFLRMPMTACAKEIMQEGSRGAESFLAKGDKITVLKRIGIAAEGALDDAFASHGFGTWAPNTPYTVAMKGSDSPLIDTGQLRRAVDSEVMEG